jgi:nucleoside-diphosphate-sugar epimerase
MEAARELAGTRVGVTGAGGFIGRRVCARLAEAGAEVVGLDSSPDAAGAVEAAGAELRPCDVTDADAVAAALSDCARVVHTAALVSDWGPMEDFVRVNVGGTRNVLDAAARAGAERVVHVSSVAIWGYEFTDDVSEDAEPRPCGIPYIDTKGTSDVLARGRGATVVRPGDVYGPGSGQWAVRSLEGLRSGLIRLPAGGRGLITPVYVDDLVECVVLALVVAGAEGAAVCAHDGHPVTAADFFGHYARMLGKPAVGTLPRPLLSAAVLAQELFAHATGRPPSASRAALTFISRRAAYPNTRAREVLGWEPRVSLEEGMRRTEEWFYEVGLLER